MPRNSLRRMAVDVTSEAKDKQLLERVRAIASALPDVTETTSHGMPTFWVAGKKTFAMFAVRHHDDPYVSLWFAAPPGAQHALVASDAERFFLPPYVAFRGWAGLRLDGPRDVPKPAKDLWTVTRDILADAHNEVAAKLPASRLRSRS